MGYHLAGFDVVGVDISPQPHYPFPFIQADAMTFPLDEFDIIHASPPCQAYTVLLRGRAAQKNHPDLLGATRRRLMASGKPWIIENVIGAPIQYGIQLCGAMFDLRIYRHRWFETSFFLFQPWHPKHMLRAARVANIPKEDEFYSPGGHMGDRLGHARAMGIDWMQDNYEIAQAIPPAYTLYIGKCYGDTHMQAGLSELSVGDTDRADAGISRREQTL